MTYPKPKTRSKWMSKHLGFKNLPASVSMTLSLFGSVFERLKSRLEEGCSDPPCYFREEVQKHAHDYN